MAESRVLIGSGPTPCNSRRIGLSSGASGARCDNRRRKGRNDGADTFDPAGGGQLENEWARRFRGRARQDRRRGRPAHWQSRPDDLPAGHLDRSFCAGRARQAVSDWRPGLPRRGLRRPYRRYRGRNAQDAGATAVIVGHSERRTDHHETDAQVRAKAVAAKRAGLTAIVCVGEQRAQREAGTTLAIVGGQLDGSLPTTRRAPIWWSPTSRSGPSEPG